MAKIQNIRSSIAGKLPTADQLSIGQIAVNISDETPMLAFKTNTDNIVVIKPTKEWEGTFEEYQALEEIDPTITYYILDD